MNCSSKLCTELLCEYSDFSPCKKKVFVGYKLAEKKGANYYSIVSGMFRYIARRVEGRSSYSELYRKEKIHYNKKLDGKLSIFKNKEDAIESLIKYRDIIDYEIKLALIEITISEDLEEAKYSNKFVSNLDVVIGGMIDKVKEIKEI